MQNAAAKARTGRSASVLSTIWRGVVRISLYNRLGHMSVMWSASRSDDASWPETNATVVLSTLTEAHADSSTRKPCPLPPEIQRRPPRDHASTAPRALEFALPGQW
jgi:hypothetical protein